LKSDNSMHFFLASNSPKGFFSKMDIFGKNLPEGWKCNVIKGSPGCGKSTYMNKIAEEMKQINTQIEYIHCPSDPDSLDAVIFPDLKLCYVDGTAPHVIDPILPGITGNIIDLSKYVDINNSNKNRSKILQLNKKSQKFYSQAQKYLISFRSILSNSIEEYIEKIDTNYIKKIFDSISKKYFRKKLPKNGQKTTRMISSFGPQGLLVLNQNFKNFDQIYQINDDLNLESDILLKHLTDLSNKSGHNNIVCINPLSFNEKIETLIIPELKLAFFVKNRWQKPNIKWAENTTKIRISKKSQINNHDKDILDLLILKATRSMEKNLSIHLEIEKIYKN